MFLVQYILAVGQKYIKKHFKNTHRYPCLFVSVPNHKEMDSAVAIYSPCCFQMIKLVMA